MVPCPESLLKSRALTAVCHSLRKGFACRLILTLAVLDTNGGQICSLILITHGRAGQATPTRASVLALLLQEKRGQGTVILQKDEKGTTVGKEGGLGTGTHSGGRGRRIT